ncbi:hypothetical protein TTHERM_000016038 (macronuclear) [Tetrahymena thermophila SB210]|uniref:Uncharacterized protein n=1 Tax=Tetrahymena thermophila (strain SB210) TaxID=312017 RepID=W7XLI8_TETTS|nr:hypothetical protein TTHERM_000016038 [Tetrahymena thermophila SB210]EWS76364.1 hypothetical protein TTHERM_000016038 [Tetrahymena thermophila SB210]|eukprot:XP_012651148.1 hypothetical protein TTHERM_000016038 [Tetrahymena thermophila SB210]
MLFFYDQSISLGFKQENLANLFQENKKEKEKNQLKQIKRKKDNKNQEKDQQNLSIRTNKQTNKHIKYQLKQQKNQILQKKTKILQKPPQEKTNDKNKQISFKRQTTQTNQKQRPSMPNFLIEQIKIIKRKIKSQK